jgi:hypothetical protein
MLVFWVVALCGLVGRYQRFGGTYCLHLQALYVPHHKVTYWHGGKAPSILKFTTKWI